MFSQKRTLLGFDRAGRAAVLARAAINAYVGIYNVAVAARSDRSYGAGFRASSASYAFLSDFMCHNTYLPWEICDTIIAHFLPLVNFLDVLFSAFFTIFREIFRFLEVSIS